MRIAINGTAAVTGGGITYLLNFLPALARLANDHEYYILLSGRQDALKFDLPARFHMHRIFFPGNSAFARLVWEQTVLPAWLRQQKVDVLYAPAGIAPLCAQCPIVLAVRNPVPHADFYPSSRPYLVMYRRVLSLLTRLSSRKSSRVLFVSQTSAQQIGDRLAIPHRKRAVVYHGLSEIFRETSSAASSTLHQYGLEDQHYVLFVSALYPHKNLETLIEAFAHWNEPSYHLVIAGRLWDKHYYSNILTIVSRWQLAERIRFLGEVPYPDLPALYRAAAVFVFPSILETFGHPLVEAMASGVPILCSDTPVTREICGDAALYFAPRNASALVEALDKVVGDSGTLRAEMIARGRHQSSRFSWEHTAQQTLTLLEQTL